MTLRELVLKPIYTSTSSDLYQEIVSPLLQCAVRYDRAVGFFSSRWLREVSTGLSTFVSHGGRARIVTSVHLSPEDWTAIQQGAAGGVIDQIIELEIEKTLIELQTDLEYRTLGALSWLIANNYMDFRFSVPKGRLSGGILHSKIALFYDKSGDAIAILGSQNDSSQAAINDETVTVFPSWGFGQSYFSSLVDAFEDKWAGNEETISTYPISEAARRKIIMVGKAHQDSYLGNLELENAIAPPVIGRALRPYQLEAITDWFENDCRGLFEMATGSGKTFTAISAASRLLERDGKLTLVVLAPFTHLVEQWAVELRVMDFEPINCSGAYKTWFPLANEALLEFKAGVRKNFCIVTTHKTAAGEKFREFTARFSKPWLLIADEVHGLGSEKQQVAMFSDASFRIGLSATAARWYDYAGTKAIKDYFQKTVISYGLNDAIKSGALAQYSYIPVCVELSETEVHEYSTLTRKISRALAKSSLDDDDVQRLLRKRAKLIGTASAKIDTLISLVKLHRDAAIQAQTSYTHNLYYCSPGQAELVVSQLASIGMKVHKFVYDVDLKERIQILKAFAAGELEGLVAIKCLDEGVDIPATRRAYILASTTNPREFVQRRGRLLRNYPGKPAPEIYDFVVGPWNSSAEFDRETARSLLRRELPRIVEFNSLSTTKMTATKDVYETCKTYEMDGLVYLEPDELYRTMKGYEPDL